MTIVRMTLLPVPIVPLYAAIGSGLPAKASLSTIPEEFEERAHLMPAARWIFGDREPSLLAHLEKKGGDADTEKAIVDLEQAVQGSTHKELDEMAWKLMHPETLLLNRNVFDPKYTVSLRSTPEEAGAFNDEGYRVIGGTTDGEAMVMKARRRLYDRFILFDTSIGCIHHFGEEESDL